MDLEKLVNQTVIHTSFGKGIIRSVDEKYLEVDFVEMGKVSKFPYPGCGRKETESGTEGNGTPFLIQ